METFIYNLNEKNSLSYFWSLLSYLYFSEDCADIVLAYDPTEKIPYAYDSTREY